MKNNLILLLVIFCGLFVSSVTVYAQATEPPTLMLGLDSGTSFASYREETYSPLRQDSQQAVVSFDLLVDDGPLRQRLGALFGMGRNSSVLDGKSTVGQKLNSENGLPESYVSDFGTDSLHAWLAYSLLGQIVTTEPYRVWIGGELRVQADVQMAAYPSVTVISGLGLAIEQELRLGPLDKLGLSLSTPLLSWAVRPPYAGADAQIMRLASDDPLAIIGTGCLVSLDQYQALRLELNWRHQAAEYLGLFFGLAAELAAINVPRPFHYAGASFNAGAALLF
jgi:hypothetical protein